MTIQTKFVDVPNMIIDYTGLQKWYFIAKPIGNRNIVRK